MPYTLLLADDSLAIHRVMELTFAGHPVTVVAVSDGAAAIARIQAAPPDIILADVGMPGPNGYDVAAYVKQQPQLAGIPVVLLTGAFEPVDEARARASCCDGVLAKPFDPDIVVRRVEELLNRRQPGYVSEAAPRERSGASDEARAERRELGGVGVPAIQAKSGASDEARAERRGSGAAEPGALGAPPRERRGAAGSPQATEPGFGVEPRLDLDEYFERLDAGLTALGTPAPAVPVVAVDVLPPTWTMPVPAARPHTEADFGATFAAAAPPGLLIGAPGDTGVAGSGGSVFEGRAPSLAEAFAALMEAERWRVRERAAGGMADSANAHDVGIDGIVEAITRAARQLVDQGGRDIVREIVSQVAERMIREEIARIKAEVEKEEHL